jgi:hypothetical protein
MLSNPESSVSVAFAWRKDQAAGRQAAKGKQKGREASKRGKAAILGKFKNISRSAEAGAQAKRSAGGQCDLLRLRCSCRGLPRLHIRAVLTRGVTPAKTFVYDAATINGAAMANAKGRLAEALKASRPFSGVLIGRACRASMLSQSAS